MGSWLETESFDFINYAYVIHEMPADNAMRVISELYRLLAPGGTMNGFEVPFVRNVQKDGHMLNSTHGTTTGRLLDLKALNLTWRSMSLEQCLPIPWQMWDSTKLSILITPTLRESSKLRSNMFPILSIQIHSDSYNIISNLYSKCFCFQSFFLS